LLVLLPFAPLLLAAVVTGSSLFVARPWAWRAGLPMPSASAPLVTAPAPPAVTPAAVTTLEVTPATTPYVVRPGDSLWKIYLSQGNGASKGKGWMDFLSSARALNKLGDPDNIKPGKVLSIVPPDR
jgi:nucleoid-associated protein YgaU